MEPGGLPVKVLLIGGSGQLGTEIAKVLLSRELGHSVVAPSHVAFDLCNPATMEGYFDGTSKWTHVINCAAFHKFESCENDPATAFQVNARGPYLLASECVKANAHLIHVSTDYVFGGHGNTGTLHRPMNEDDQPAPLNVYGASKLTGESLISTTTVRYTVARVASLFGYAGSSGKGGNFIETMIKKAKAGESISVVNDIWMSPTHAHDAAEAIVFLAEQGRLGVYHVVNQGHATWHQMARTALTAAGYGGYPVQSHSGHMAGGVSRPAWSALSTRRLDNAGWMMRSWQEAVSHYVANRPQ